MGLERRVPLRRTGMNRGTSQLRSKTPLRARSAKRRARDLVLAENRAAAIRRDDHRCQAAAAVIAVACAGGLHAHHVIRRSQGGPDDIDNLLTVCAAHHQHIHDHPAEAKSLGFLN